MVLSHQSKETEKNDLMLEKICKLNDELSQHESENLVIKQANSFLSKCLVDMERQYWAKAQYSRKERIEVVGISNSINNSELEDKVLTVFHVKKDCKKGFVKTDLIKEKLQDIALKGNQSIFINISLSLYYRILRS